MTNPSIASDLIERLEYALGMATDCEVFRGTVCDIDSADLRMLSESIPPAYTRWIGELMHMEINKRMAA